jgi:hypothetical protein
MVMVLKNDSYHLIGLHFGVLYWKDIVFEWQQAGIKWEYLGHGYAGIMVETFKIAGADDYAKAVEIAEGPDNEKPDADKYDAEKFGDYNPDEPLMPSRMYTSHDHPDNWLKHWIEQAKEEEQLEHAISEDKAAEAAGPEQNNPVYEQEEDDEVVELEFLGLVGSDYTCSSCGQKFPQRIDLGAPGFKAQMERFGQGCGLYSDEENALQPRTCTYYNLLCELVGQ